MSPVLIPRGYTKSYLDGEIDHNEQMADIRRAYLNIVKSTSNNSSRMMMTIREGTGHAGVSIFLHIICCMYVFRILIISHLDVKRLVRLSVLAMLGWRPNLVLMSF